MTIFNGQADLLATLVASSSTFQTLTGTATVAAAKAFCAIATAFDEAEGSNAALAYPRAVISDGGVCERESVSLGNWKGSGSLYLGFEIEIPSGSQTTILTQRTYFLDRVSAIMREMEVVADSRATPSGYSTSHLQIKRYVKTAGPDMLPPDEREQGASGSGRLSPLWAMEFEVSY